MLSTRIRCMLILIPMIALIIGCSNQNADTDNKDWRNQEPIQVELIVPETSVDAGTNVEIRARVTQSGEPVEDADRVVFEIWREDSDDEHERITAEHSEDGLYVIEKSFSEAGTYNIVSHVDARTWHVMPRKQLIVEEASSTSQP